MIIYIFHGNTKNTKNTKKKKKKKDFKNKYDILNDKRILISV